MPIFKYLSGTSAAALLIASATGLGSTSAVAENLDSPAPISVISVDDISRQGITTIEDIADLVPSLIADPSANPGTNRITIRGLRASPFQENVGIYIDGVDISSQSLTAPGGSILPNPHFWGDIQSIEVVKGPSALYGRNASAGIINITTRRPGDEFGGHVGFDVGNEGRYSTYGGISGPVFGGLSLGIDAGYWSKEGFYNNQITGKEVGGGEGWGIDINGSWKVTDNFSVTGRISYSEDDYDQQAQAYIPANASIDVPAAALPAVPPPGVASTSAAVHCVLQDSGAGVVSPLREAIIGLMRDPGPGGNIYCDTPVEAFVGIVPNADQLDVVLSPNFLSGGSLPGSERDVFRLSFSTNWDTGFGTLSSTTGYTNAETSTFADRDKFAVAGAMLGDDVSTIMQILHTDSEIMQVSQDLRFTSNFDSPFQFTFGGLYWYEKVEQDDRNHLILAAGSLCILPTFIFDACPGYTTLPAGQFVPAVHAAKPVDRTERSTRHLSVFGSVEFEFTDQLKLIANGRYIDEEVKLTGPNTLPGGGQQDSFLQGPDFVDVCGVGDCGAPPFTFGTIATEQVRFTRGDSYYVHGARLEWSTEDDAVIYGSYSIGKTPGGFATTLLRNGTELGIDPDHNGSASELEFDPERIKSIEVGASGIGFNDTVNINLAFFFQNIDDKQVITQIGTIDDGGDPILIDSISNDAEANIYGVEVEGNLQPTENWNFGASYTYLHSEYDRFSTLSTNAAEIAAVGSCAPVTLDGVPTCRINRSGNEVEGVPQHSFVSSATYTAPLTGNMDWFFQARGSFQGERYVDSANTVMLDGYWLSDLRLGVTADTWDIVFYVDNLLDNDTVRSAFTQADVANAEHRVGVCVFICAPFPTIATANTPIAAIANLPDPRTWGVRGRFRF